MKEIKLMVTEKQFKVIQNVTLIDETSIEDLVFDAVKSWCVGALEQGAGILFGYGDQLSYDFIFDDTEPPGPHQKKTEPAIPDGLMEYAIKTIAHTEIIKKCCGELEQQNLLGVRNYINGLLEKRGPHEQSAD